MTYEEAKEIFETLEVQVPLGCSKDFQVARELAIKAIEKQMPKKVGKIKETDYGSPYYCPECEAEIIPVEFFSLDGSEPKEKVSYCWKCGRAIDWSE